MKKRVECPYCNDGIANLKNKPKTLETAKGKFLVKVYYFYECEICNEEFTTTQSDTESLKEFFQSV